MHTMCNTQPTCDSIACVVATKAHTLAQTIRHTQNIIVTLLINHYSKPCLLQFNLKVFKTGHLLLVHFCLQVSPSILDGRQVWGLCWPWLQDLQVRARVKVSFSLLCCVHRCSILLKNWPPCVAVHNLMEGRQQTVFKYVDILFCCD